MTDDELNEVRMRLSAALNAEAHALWGTEYLACSDRQGQAVMRAVLARWPSYRRAFEQSTGPRVISVDFPAAPAGGERPRAQGTMITMSERRRDVRARYGFTETDMLDPFRRGMVDNISRSEARLAASRERYALEAEVAAVGAELGLDPTRNYHDRCRVFTELARRGHPVAAERYGRPA